MAIVKTEALVLRRSDFSETSQVAALLTPRFGRVNAIAKGIRAIWLKPSRARRMDGPLDMLTLARIVYYQKRGESLDILSDVDVIHTFVEARRNLRRWYASLVVAELAMAAARPRHADADLFYAAVRGMVEIAGDADVRLATIDFLARWLAAVGHAPDVSHCVVSGKPLPGFDRVVIGVRDGRGWGERFAPDHVPGGRVLLTGTSVEVLRRLLAGVRKPLSEVWLPDDIILPLANLLQGMVVEAIDRKPISFGYLNWLPESAPIHVRPEPARR